MVSKHIKSSETTSENRDLLTVLRDHPPTRDRDEPNGFFLTPLEYTGAYYYKSYRSRYWHGHVRYPGSYYAWSHKLTARTMNGIQKKVADLAARMGWYII